METNNQNKKKVLFFLPNCLGGSEHVLITIAKYLNRDSYDVRFVVVAATTKDIQKILPPNYSILHYEEKTNRPFQKERRTCH